ncbi:hypothetical protein ULMS_16780 [Patiriisocius marinistellae]|uniref:NlpC/P60 domain-containing protein n=1 Tax=Patiriisocius marinistellae TaxID=2494560 RepID=A0A5J4FVV3_9FLAO|nr:NlpC/P60 family protein [Patiriisocius marinistellae]GEQ86170.1 hypothetical protein ULMS_16780 [Patiriisocius marinistellae]
MKKTLLLIGLLLFSTIGFAQTFEGTIIDEESRTVISYAVVSIDGAKIQATTDLDGKFSISDELPRGEQVVIVTKEGYEDHYFLIDVDPDKKVVVENIGLEMTKDEIKRRKKLRKAQEKEEEQRLKDEEDRLKEARKNREKEEKRLAKELKKAKKRGGSIEVDYEDAVIDSEPRETDPIVDEPIETSDVEEISPIQIKYGAILGKTPEEITNIQLYTFIDDWMGTPYKMGGANTDGIDCSSFAQRLFTGVYGMYIERTAQKQRDSKYTDEFSGKQYLKEGDLLFFGESEYEISHVGIYLGNNYFVNATSRRGSTGVSGVKISNLAENYWSKKFISAGRRHVKDN